MKVLHLISGGDKGGAKTHVFALLSALKEDIDVTIACFMEGVFYQEIKDMPINSILIKQKFRYDMSVIKELVALIRKEQFHLIHSHGARANFIAMILKRHIGIPIISTVHSDYRLDFTQNLYKKLFFTELNAVSLRFMDYYIAVSDNFKKMLVERNFKDNLIYPVYNAIDFNQKVEIRDKKTFLEEYGVDYEGKILVGIIGRFDYVKGHDIFIKACAEVLKENKNVLFLLAGEGDEEENLKKSARQLGIENNVVFLGFIKEIYSFINAIDVNVLSSYSESFPYVLLEGAFMKKATVSTAVGGIPDLIISDKTGYLAEPANPQDLGKQILKMVNDDEKRIELGNGLYDYAKSNFSRDSLKNRHLEIYNDVLKREKEKNKLFDVVLSGYYGFSNSGDEAILEAIISRLKEEKEDIKILVLSKQPKETTEKYGVFSLYRYNFPKVIKYLKSVRVFINGGGSLIQDITSTNSLVYYTFLMNSAKNLGLKVMLYANGIGPITKKINVERSRKALNRCDYITLRDPDSLKELEDMGVTDVPISLSADATLNTKKISDEEVKEIFRKEDIDINGKYFGLSFRQWKYNDPEFVRKISEIVKYVNKTYGLTPLFIPMQFPNDQTISNEIISMSGVKSYMLKREYGVKELLGIISCTEFVISMRLHTLIYSVSVNVPIIGIIYDPKIKSFMDYVNQNKYIDTKNIEVDKIIEMINDIEVDTDNIKNTLEEEVLKLKKLCYQDPKIAISLLEQDNKQV